MRRGAGRALLKRPITGKLRMPEQSGALIASAHPIERIGMLRTGFVPTPETAFDIGVAADLPPREPGRGLAAQHSSCLAEMQLHGSGTIKQSVDSGNGFAHLLLDTCDAEPGQLGDLAVAQTVEPVREENRARFRAQH